MTMEPSCSVWLLLVPLLSLLGGTMSTTTVTCTVSNQADCSTLGAGCVTCSGGCCNGQAICCIVSHEEESSASSLGGLEVPLIVGISVASFFGLCVIIALVVICIMKCKKKSSQSNNMVRPVPNQTPVQPTPQASSSQEQGKWEDKPPSYEFATRHVETSEPPRYDTKHPPPKYNY